MKEIDLLSSFLNKALYPTSRNALSSLDQRRIVVCNIVSFFLALLSSPYIVIFYLIDMPLLSFFNFLITLIWGGLIPYLNKLGKFDLAKYLFIFMGSSFIFIYSVFLHTNSGVQFFFFNYAAVPLIFFSWKQKLKVILSCSFALICLVSSYVYSANFGSIYQLSPATNEFLFFAFLVSSFLLLIISTGNSAIGNEKSENSFSDMLLQLERAQEKLVHNEKLASMGTMSAGLAHEINNPLAIIDGKARLIRRACDTGRYDPETYDRHWASISSGVDRISVIIQSLLSYIKPRLGRDHEPHLLSKIIQDAKIYSDLSGQNLRFSTELANEDLLVVCNRNEIRTVLVHLIKNASQHLKKQSNPWIKVQADDIGSRVVVSIINNGDKIPSNIQKKVFDPFFTTMDVGEGSGLGLSVVKGIIESHGGKIALKNKSSNTCFTFDLPTYQNLK